LAGHCGERRQFAQLFGEPRSRDRAIGGAGDRRCGERRRFGPLPSLDVLALDEALAKLATIDAQKARVVELRFFGGLSVDETADTLGVSASTVDRDWVFARTWLHRAMSDERRA
jgi:DNA-directed RNA polymerase specialized sigma24 family protein